MQACLVRCWTRKQSPLLFFRTLQDIPHLIPKTSQVSYNALSEKIMKRLIKIGVRGKILRANRRKNWFKQIGAWKWNTSINKYRGGKNWEPQLSSVIPTPSQESWPFIGFGRRTVTLRCFIKRLHCNRELEDRFSYRYEIHSLFLFFLAGCIGCFGKVESSQQQALRQNVILSITYFLIWWHSRW